MKPPQDQQVLWIPFAKGLAQDQDPTARPYDVPLALTDVEQEKRSKWGTRRGYHRLTKTVDHRPLGTPSSMDSVRALFSTGGDDAELCAVTDHFLLAYNEENDGWMERGVVSPFALRQEPVFQDDFTYPSADMVIHDGYVLRAGIRRRQNSSGTAEADYTTALCCQVASVDGSIILPHEVVGETATLADKYHSVKCAAVGGILLAAAQQDLGAPNTIKAATWNARIPTTSGLFASPSTLVSDAWYRGAQQRIFDIIGTSRGAFLLAYIDNANQNIELVEYNLSLSTTGVSYTLTANDPYVALAIAEDTVNGQILVLAQTESDAGEPYTAGTMRLYGIDLVGGAINYNVLLATLVNGVSRTEDATDLGVVPDYTNSRAVCMWTRYYDGGLYRNDHTTVDNISRVLSTGAAIDSLERTYNARAVSKPWVRNGRSYAALATTLGIDIFDAVNGDHFQAFGVDPLVSPWDVNWVADLRAGEDTAEDPGRPVHLVGLYDVGKAPQLGPQGQGRGRGNGQTVSNLPDYLDDPSGATEGPEWRWLCESSARQLAGQDENVSQMELRADFAAPVTWARVHGGAVAIGGGFVSWYDGDRVTELGHTTAPITYDYTITVTGGAIADDVDLQYVPVWYWTDGRNFVHRSPPGPPAEVSPTGGTGNDNIIDVSARNNPATNRVDAPGVSCVWFRGDDDGSYKRISQPVRVIPLLDTQAETEDFRDTGSLTRSDILYTQSGELEAIAPEGARIVAMVNRRLKLGDMVRWFNIQFSKPPDAGIGGAYGLAPELNEALSLQIEGDREVTGMGALDDKWVVFTSSAIYLVAGEGPTDDGLNSDFSGLTLVNGNVGCIEARSVIEVPSTAGGFPGGLFFQSDAGVYLLDRGTGLHFIGAGVEDDTATYPIVTSASHDVEHQLVIFTVCNAAESAGAILVYDYEAGAWSKWQPREAGGAAVVPVAGCMHRGQHYFADPNGQVWQQQLEAHATRYEFTVSSSNSSLSTGVVTLPSWLTLTRADSFCTTRTGASTVVSGIAANTARAYSEDGSTIGFLVEPSMTNLVTSQDLDTYAKTGTPVVSSATLPDGTTENAEVADDDGGTQERIDLTTATSIAVGNYTMSAWRDKTDSAGVTSSIQGIAAGSFFSPGLGLDTSTVTGGWEYATESSVGNVTTGTFALRIIPAAGAANTGTLRAALLQVEARAYPTSYRAGIRVVETLTTPIDTFSPGGWFKLSLTYAPQYANDEAAADHHLFYIDANNRCYWDESAGEFVLRIGGSDVVTTASSPTWSRLQQLTVTMWSLPTGCGITISGATTGDGSTTASAQSKLAPSSSYAKFSAVTLLGGSAGTEEGSVLYSVTISAHPSYFDDGQEWIQATIETADLFGGQPGGWQRVRRFVPVVERYETYGTTVGLDATVTTDGVAGDTKQFSATMVDDWEGQKVPIEVRPDRAKCQSARLKLQPTEGASAESGRGLAFSGVRVHVRPRPTPARLGLDGGNQRS